MCFVFFCTLCWRCFLWTIISIIWTGWISFMIWRSNKRWPIFLLRHRSWGHCHFVGYCIPLTEEETGGDLAIFKKKGQWMGGVYFGGTHGDFLKNRRMNAICTVDAMHIVCRYIIYIYLYTIIISIIQILHHLHYTCIWYDPSCVFCTTVFFFRMDRPIIDSELGQKRNSFRAAWKSYTSTRGVIILAIWGESNNTNLR